MVLRQLSSTTKVGEVLTPDMLRGSGGGRHVKKLIAEVSSFPGFPQERPGSRKTSALDPGPSPGTAGAYPKKSPLRALSTYDAFANSGNHVLMI